MTLGHTAGDWPANAAAQGSSSSSRPGRRSQEAAAAGGDAGTLAALADALQHVPEFPAGWVDADEGRVEDQTAEVQQACARA
jgi:hypothetical protein